MAKTKTKRKGKLRREVVKADVEAAGGVILRESKAGKLQVAVIHRPRYGDWSMPKGKLEKGETFKEAAVREVEEETGFRCKAVEELSPVTYKVGKSRLKLVRFWLMRVKRGKFVPNEEVDELRWLTPSKARDLLSYEYDCELLDEALAIVD
jgi:8-oxo-dGTP pyrophosphatase MutT (NUDIX family)